MFLLAHPNFSSFLVSYLTFRAATIVDHRMLILELLSSSWVRYELLFSPEQVAQSAFSVIVPLIATVGINGKVTFLEKWGTG